MNRGLVGSFDGVRTSLVSYEMSYAASFGLEGLEEISGDVDPFVTCCFKVLCALSKERAKGRRRY